MQLQIQFKSHAHAPRRMYIHTHIDTHTPSIHPCTAFTHPEWCSPCSYEHTYKHIQTERQEDRHTHIQTEAERQTHTDTHNTHAHKHTQSQTHTVSHRHTHTHRTHMHVCTHACARAHTHTHTHTHKQTKAHMHVRMHTKDLHQLLSRQSGTYNVNLTSNTAASYTKGRTFQAVALCQLLQ